MTRRLPIVTLLILLILPSARAAVPVEAVMTYNIRYKNAGDTGAISWENRAPFIISMIRYHDPDLIGFQEVLHTQLKDLSGALPQYAWSGVGREDGVEKGEYALIFYRKDRYRLLAEGHFWLSETPEQPGKGWDAACERICSWVKLKELAGGRVFCFFDTHFDHVGETARQQSAKLIMQRIDSIAGNLPVILAGDFNSNEKSEARKIICGGTHALVRMPLKDTFGESRLPHHGPAETFCGFDLADGIIGERIDYVFERGYTVDDHATLTDFTGKHFPSDHFPVLTHLRLSR